MARSFDNTTRRNIAELCAAFTRVQGEDAAPALQAAGVPAPQLFSLVL